MRQKLWLAITAGLLLSFLSTQNASAHAKVESSVPSNNEVLAGPTDLIQVKWNEPVESEANLFKVTKDGTLVKIESVEISYNTATIKLSEKTKPGSYKVTWKVLSEDSHLVSGELNFAYASKIAILKDISIPYLEITQKTLKILTWLLFLVLLALVLIGRKDRITKSISIVVSLLSLCQIGLIVSEIKLPISKTINLIPETKTLLLFALTPIIYLLIKKPYLPLIAIFSLAGLFTGHHKTVDGKLGDLTTFAHVTHLAAVAAWVSAVAAILLSKDATQVKLSSKISIISVAVLIPVGVTQSIILARPFENNHWVKVMLVKIALLTLTLFLGLLNNLSLRKSKFVNKKIVKLEVLSFISILIVSSILTSKTPPSLSFNPVANIPVTGKAIEITLKNNIESVTILVNNLCPDCESTWQLLTPHDKATVTLQNKDGGTVVTEFDSSKALIIIPQGVWKAELETIDQDFNESKYLGEVVNL